MDIFTNDTRIFHILDGVPQYLDCMGVWRIMWNGGDRRVILRGCGDSYKWLHDFPNGCTLELTIPFGRDSSVYEDNRTMYRFQNCYENRRWIPQPTAFSPDELMRLDAWIEIRCDVDFVNEENPTD